jgi:HEAT repeat protein
MQRLRFSRLVNGFAMSLALVIVLGCVRQSRADRFPPDPVLEFRQALSLPLREYLPRDPELLKKLEEGPEDARRNYLKNARTSDILRRMETLKSIPELRRALAAQEWRDKGDGEQNIIDNSLRDILVQRFATRVVDALENGSLTARLATMGMLAEIGTNNRLVDDRTRVAKIFTPVLTKLIRTASNPLVRIAAARTVSQIGCDPGEAAPALGDLLKSNNVEERRAAAEGLAGILILLNNLSNQSPSAMTDERAIRDGAVPSDNQIVLFARREVITAANKVLPFAKIGTADSDFHVRRHSLNCIYQAVFAMGQQIPQPLNTGEMGDIRDDALRVQETRRVLMPLLETFRDLADALGRATRDSDPEVRLLARKAIEELSSARNRLPTPPSQVDDARTDPLLDALIRMEPDLIAGVKDPDVATRLLAIDALEAMGKQGVAAAPVLTAAIRDPNQFVRWAAARTMGKMAPVGAEQAVPALRNLIHDREIDLCLAAATALERYGPAAVSAVPDLIEASHTTDVVLRVAALRAILGIGTGASSAIPAIAEELKDRETRVRQTAAEVLGQFGPLAIGAEAALREALNDSAPEVRRAAGDALLNILRVGEKK